MLGRSTAVLFSSWDPVNKSPRWQDRIFHILAALYELVTAVALVQLVRIQLRVPEYGWTTQKVFHFLYFLVNGVRCLVFIFRRDIQDLEPEARAVSTDWLRPTSYTINGVVYAIRIVLWLVLGGRIKRTTQETTAGWLCDNHMHFMFSFEVLCGTGQKAVDLDVLDHPVLNFIYYLLVEILPSALVLFILRKLPPRRGVTQYHPIR